MTGHDVRTLPPFAFAGGGQLSVPEDTVRLLQAAAHDANQRFPARPAAAPAPRPAAARGDGSPRC